MIMIMEVEQKIETNKLGIFLGQMHFWLFFIIRFHYPWDCHKLYSKLFEAAHILNWQSRA